MAMSDGKLKAARDLHVSRDRANRAEAVLEPYMKASSGQDTGEALLNFLVDFLHLAVVHQGSPTETDKLKALIDRAAELHSAEPSARVSGTGGVVNIPWY